MYVEYTVHSYTENYRLMSLIPMMRVDLQKNTHTIFKRKYITMILSEAHWSSRLGGFVLTL